MFSKSTDLIAYTLRITNNQSRFPKKIRFSITNRLQDASLLIYDNLLIANEIDPVDIEDYRERKRHHRKALALCKRVLFLIEDSLEQDRIEEGSCSFWSGLVVEVQSRTEDWMESDIKRFKDL